MATALFESTFFKLTDVRLGIGSSRLTICRVVDAEAKFLVVATLAVANLGGVNTALPH